MKHDGPTRTLTFASTSGDTADNVLPYRERPPARSASAIDAFRFGLRHHEVTWPSIGFGNGPSGSATIFAPRGIELASSVESPTNCQRSAAVNAPRASSGLPMHHLFAPTILPIPRSSAVVRPSISAPTTT